MADCKYLLNCSFYIAYRWTGQGTSLNFCQMFQIIKVSIGAQQWSSGLGPQLLCGRSALQSRSGHLFYVNKHSAFLDGCLSLSLAISEAVLTVSRKIDNISLSLRDIRGCLNHIASKREVDQVERHLIQYYLIVIVKSCYINWK